MKAALAFAALLVAAPHVARARCGTTHLQPEVLTPDATAPEDGGIVVGTVGVPWDQPELGDAVQPSWGFLTGLDLGVPVITVLAPGLAVYAPHADMRITGELTDGKKTIAHLTFDPHPPPRLAAPKAVAITHAKVQDRRPTVDTIAMLSADPPAGALALVLLDGKTKRPRSWGLVTAGRAQTVYRFRRCETLPTGTVESKVGDRVMLAWVDRTGRMSPPSAAIRISRAKSAP